MKINLAKVLKFTLWLWIFLIPFQLYLNKGISISVSLILLAVNTILVMLLLGGQKNPRKIARDMFMRNSLFLFLGVFILISFLVNRAVGESVEWKELARWGVFFVEYFVLYLSLKLKYLKVEDILKGLIFSAFVLTLISIYQPFVSVDFEKSTVARTFGELFNDPELVANKFNSIGKFNWEYGPVVRVHGVLANVSQFAFILGIGLLALRDFSYNIKKKISVAAILLGLFLATFLHLSLVRSSFLSLGVVVLIDIINQLRNRKRAFAGWVFPGVFISGFFLAAIVGWISRDHLVGLAIIARFVEWVTLDGLWLEPVQRAFAQMLSALNIKITEYNEYGGVGGRLYIFKETAQNIVIPNLLSLKYLLLGFGPGSFGNIFKEVVHDDYFTSFGSADNSYVLWVVEFGIAAFLFAGYYILFNLKNLVKKYGQYWYWILFLVLEFMFKNTVPDLRISALIAVVLSYLAISVEKR